MQARPFLPLMFIASDRRHPATRAAKGQGVVLGLEPHQRIEQHPVVRIERDVVLLHARLVVLVRIVAVNAEFHRCPQYVRVFGGNDSTVSGVNRTGL